VSITTYQHN